MNIPAFNQIQFYLLFEQLKPSYFLLVDLPLSFRSLNSAISGNTSLFRTDFWFGFP